MEDINKGKCIEAERKNQGKVVRIAKAAPQGMEGDAFLHGP